MIIPYTEFFEFEKLKEKPLNSYTGVSSGSVSKIERLKKNKTYRKMRDNTVLNYLIMPLAHPVVKRRLKKAKNGIPKFVIEEWKNINRIETQLYPHQQILDNVEWYEAKNGIGETYYQLIQQVTKKPDYVFIVPWIIRGGGDKAILNYVEALHELHKDWHFAVIATNPNIDSVWANKLPDCVDFVEFGKCVEHLHIFEWDRVMSTLITQLGCKRLHIINSMFGYEWVMRHKELVKANYKLNVTLFADEYIVGSDQRGIFGYDDPYLTDIIDAVRMVTTDNHRMIDRMAKVDGFVINEKFKVHYQPVVGEKVRSAKKKMVEDGKLHILWAGRVVSVKMPELVAEIGKRLDPKKFVIDVFGEMGNDIDKNVLNGIPTIKYHGGFDGFDTLPINKSDIFLYTSRTDGMPNTILEATLAGLPIIASNDGGVGELIKDGETGILVEDMLNPDAYVEKLEKINDVKRLEKYVKNAQKLVETRHSWATFLDNVDKDLVDREKE